MENNLEKLGIGAFAKAAGVNVETIRFYQRMGLLPEPARNHQNDISVCRKTSVLRQMLAARAR